MDELEAFPDDVDLQSNYHMGQREHEGRDNVKRETAEFFAER
jgi:hypothetical protein